MAEVLTQDEAMLALMEDKTLDTAGRRKKFQGIVQKVGDQLRRDLDGMLLYIGTPRELAPLPLTSPGWYFSAAVHGLAGLALFIAGIGLLLLQRWGHRVVVVVAIVEAVHLLIEFVVFLTTRMGAASSSSPLVPYYDILALVALDWFFLVAQIIVLLQGGVRQLFRRPQTAKAAPTVDATKLRPKVDWGKRLVRALGALSLGVALLLLTLATMEMQAGRGRHGPGRQGRQPKDRQGQSQHQQSHRSHFRPERAANRQNRYQGGRRSEPGSQETYRGCPKARA